MKRLFLLFAVLVLLASCTHMSELPLSFRSELIAEAEKYIGIPYEWGGQSFWWEDDPSVDCSGFVINVYESVLERHGRHLLFDDTTAYALWDEYTLPVEDPLAGDLIFFTDGVSDEVSHVAIFIREEAGVLFFIDASSLPDTMKVMERSYPADNAKIHSFARMLYK